MASRAHPVELHSPTDSLTVTLATLWNLKFCRSYDHPQGHPGRLREIHVGWCPPRRAASGNSNGHHPSLTEVIPTSEGESKEDITDAWIQIIAEWQAQLQTMSGAHREPPLMNPVYMHNKLDDPYGAQDEYPCDDEHSSLASYGSARGTSSTLPSPVRHFHAVFERQDTSDCGDSGEEQDRLGEGIWACIPGRTFSNSALKSTNLSECLQMSSQTMGQSGTSYELGSVVQAVNGHVVQEGIKHVVDQTTQTKHTNFQRGRNMLDIQQDEVGVAPVLLSEAFKQWATTRRELHAVKMSNQQDGSLTQALNLDNQGRESNIAQGVGSVGNRGTMPMPGAEMQINNAFQMWTLLHLWSPILMLQAGPHGLHTLQLQAQPQLLQPPFLFQWCQESGAHTQGCCNIPPGSVSTAILHNATNQACPFFGAHYDMERIHTFYWKGSCQYIPGMFN
ncbi:hypothetical protein C8T65DRAFT_702719 [Cerioporus squamosus]|nr:hypothetical protein C8T65DRAFT_702719 [Cerioporus squamosus]